jgi:hypothetical protein
MELKRTNIGGLLPGAKFWCIFCIIANPIFLFFVLLQADNTGVLTAQIVLPLLIQTILMIIGYSILLSGRQLGFYIIFYSVILDLFVDLIINRFQNRFQIRNIVASCINPLITWLAIRSSWEALKPKIINYQYRFICHYCNHQNDWIKKSNKVIVKKYSKYEIVRNSFNNHIFMGNKGKCSKCGKKQIWSNNSSKGKYILIYIIFLYVTAFIGSLLNIWGLSKFRYVPFVIYVLSFIPTIIKYYKLKKLDNKYLPELEIKEEE